MEDLRKIVQEIFDEGYLMSLGTFDESGPWVSDVLFVTDDELNIYWLSSAKTRHSKAVEGSGKASATITLTAKLGDDEKGLQIEGKAEKIDGARLDLAKKHWKKRGKAEPMTEDEVLDPDEFWYRLTPTKIEIINAPMWGFKKKSLEI